jgi:large subunit ribosomal protein L9
MELILIRDVAHVGCKGDVVKVSDGYARNFLFPRKLAVASTRSNRQFVAEQRERAEKRKEIEREKARGKVAEISQIKLTVRAKVGEKGKLFGSVTAEHISDELKQRGYDIDKRQIILKDSIRSTGSYSVPVEIYSGVRASVTLEVVEEQPS